MRSAATARLRLRVGAYEKRRRSALLQHIAAMLLGADEKPRRLLVHATVIAATVAAAVAAILFGM
jgi:hypothetical protein